MTEQPIGWRVGITDSIPVMTVCEHLFFAVTRREREREGELRGEREREE